MARKRGTKRKNLTEDDKKSIRKEAKYLHDFGEEHPIKDKLNKFEDRFAKRVYYDNEEVKVEKNCRDDKREELEEVEPNYYEQLLNIFGKQKEVTPESDESDVERVYQNDNSNLNDLKKIQSDDNEEEFRDKYDEPQNSSGEVNNQNFDELKFNSNDDSVIDNFALHFFTDFESSDIEALETSKQIVTPFQWPQLGSFIESRTELEKFNLIKIDKPAKNLDQIQLKPLLKENIPKSMMELTRKEHQNLTPFQLELLTLLTSYKNLYYSERTFENANEIRLAYSVHALNHILKTRSRITLHNAKINLHQITDKEEYRDQGLTRPKVLIILPFRDSALQTVNCMINLLFGNSKDSGEKKINLMNYKRFKKEFSQGDDSSQISSRRPEDYKQLFAGNIDDSFRFGLSLTKKSLKIYSDFYSSDIIIASPLGLRLIIGTIGEEGDYDFLSSIEIVIFDQADVFLMQNWEHVLHLMSHLHLKPRETHGVDFSRVKLWVLELWSRYYCQLVMFSSVSCSMITGFFNKYSTNFDGKLLFRNEILKSRAAINCVYIQCPQIFYKFQCASFASSSETRFEFFIKQILPKFRDPMMVRTMIFIPSYFDYVRLRNYFRKEDISFTQICEYSKKGKVAKARHIFFYGGRHFLLYTERFHFFHRYTIKGIRHLIFYEPPLYPNFYAEIINSMNRANQGNKMLTDYSSMSVTVLYNKFDLHSLVSLVGTSALATLLSTKMETDVHMFLSKNVLGS